MSSFKQNITSFVKGVTGKVFDKAKTASDATMQQNIQADDKCTGVTRKASTNCCPMCTDLAGTYDKKNAKHEGAYSFHSKDRCTLTPTFKPVSNKLRAKMDKAKMRNNKLNVVDDSAKFQACIEDAKAHNRHGGFVDNHSVEELNTFKKILSEDGMCGVAIKPDGDITCVFKNEKVDYRGAIYDLMITARENGGVKLDCYGRRLVNAYEKCGFEPVARVKFDPQFVADEALLKEKPDIYFMKRTSKTSLEIVDDYTTKKYKKSAQKELDKLPLFNYETAGAYRDRLLSHD